MAHPLLHTLKSSFKTFLGFYVDAFPRAYVSYMNEKPNGQGTHPTAEQYQAYFNAYVTILEQNLDAIFRAAAQELGDYLNLYNIHANQSADEYKLIYFLGSAMGKHVGNRGLLPLQHVHYYIMIGLLADRLQQCGKSKPQLTRAMKRLIRAGQLEAQLGKTGAYLVYKSVSTAL